MRPRSLVITAVVALLIVALLAGCSGNTTGKQQSGNRTQRSTKIKTYLSFSASPAVLDFKYGRVLAFAGQLRGRGESGLSGKTVLIQRKEGSSWSTLFSVETNKNGFYSKRYNPSAGTYYFRAHYPGDSRYQPASDEQKVTVK